MKTVTVPLQVKPATVYRVLAVLAGIRDALLILLILAIFGLGAYTYGQLAGWADRVAPAPTVLDEGACDTTYPDALPC